MEFIFLIAVLIFSVVIHEVSHGAMANFLGDPTAKEQGRLTLNPLKHLDMFGSIILPASLILISKFTNGGGFIFGWAKPVPVNPLNFNDKKWGQFKVALAGPGANLAVALVFGLTLRFLPDTLALNLASGFFLMLSYIVYINILLAIFNLLPIPPLDGSHLLFSVLPYSAQKIRIFLNQFSIFILLFFILFLFSFLNKVINFIFSLIVGTSLF